MLKLKSLNKKGFGYVEMIVFAVVILAIGVIGYYALNSSSAGRGKNGPGQPKEVAKKVAGPNSFVKASYSNPPINIIDDSNTKDNCWVKQNWAGWGHNDAGPLETNAAWRVSRSNGSAVTTLDVFWGDNTGLQRIDKPKTTGVNNHVYPEVKVATERVIVFKANCSNGKTTSHKVSYTQLIWNGTYINNEDNNNF